MTDPAPDLTAALAHRYRLEQELGEGGMATVYLAYDLRHERPVALKVMRPELAAAIGAERFLAEIRTTANLQHPHILPLFDSGEAGGFLYYVMPFVEGESLRERLDREKQLPVADALRIAAEVASALDYAHRHGVIHRDIKPENVLLPDGRALVADFGIALAVSTAGRTRLTESGMSLGTPYYMSPEQAMGEREITGRSDVYGLGCVLYEALAGEPPFTGPTAQAILARVLTEEPRPLLPQRHTIPPHVEAAILIALEKLPADRFPTAAAFAEALADPGRAHQPGGALAGAVPSAGRSRWRRWILLASTGVAGALLGALVWGGLRAGGARSDPVHRHYIVLGNGITVAATGPALALSPEGTTLVFRDGSPDGPLWVKRGTDLEPVPIPGTERATNPVFSPDGAWLAFVADGRLRKIRPTGGEAETLADSAVGPFGGAAWLDDGSLLYVSRSARELRRVGPEGGASTLALGDSGLAGAGMGQPTPLPGARGALLQICSSPCVTMSVHVLDLARGVHTLLLRDVAQAWYLPTGHLLYVRQDGLGLVAPFDLRRLEVTGPAVPVLERVMVGVGFAQLAWSASGELVYLSGPALRSESMIVRVSRDGAVTPIDTAWRGPFTSLSLSPDGRRLAVGAGGTAGSLNVWIKHLDRGPFSRLSFGGGDRRPVWSPDGLTVAFLRDTAGTTMVAARPADGSRPDTILARLDRRIQEVEWSPDGRWLVLRTDDGAIGAGDIVGIRTGGDTVPVSLVEGPFSELHPEVSPDGRWLAYTSNESGREEVYVRPFPGTGGGRWQVSTGGGRLPRWSPDGSELIYFDQGQALFAARVATAPAFTTEPGRRLFDAPWLTIDGFHQAYEVLGGGRGFIMISPTAPSTASAPRLVRVENWLRNVQSRVSR